MTTAGLLLTGGASRRMGRDKGQLPSLGGGETLAQRTGRLLGAVAAPALEIGPGISGLDAVPDPVPHAGPLAALATGAQALRAAGHGRDEGDCVLVVATDLPRLSAGMLRWLADHPSGAAVVPIDAEGRRQPLCARYRWHDLERGEALVAAGASSLRALLEAIGVEYLPAVDWAAAAGGVDGLDDVDTPEDLMRAQASAAPPPPSGAAEPAPERVGAGPMTVAPLPAGPAAAAPPPRAVTDVRAIAVRADHHLEVPEQLATEEPLEIRAAGPGQESLPVAVTMRTPGNDFDLAVGFLLTEGLVARHEVAAVAYCAEVEPDRRWNTVTVALTRPWDPEINHRAFDATSSCGVCGKATIDDIEVACPMVPPGVPIPASLLVTLPDRLRRSQRVFDRTGGLHAAGLFTPGGELRCLREDVGRHNAVDKIVGRGLLHSAARVTGGVLVVSGRVSFEIVQKTAMAGFGLLVAVSAPSSLSVAAAERLGVTVAGFVRDGRMNVYSHPERVDFAA